MAQAEQAPTAGTRMLLSGPQSRGAQLDPALWPHLPLPALLGQAALKGSPTGPSPFWGVCEGPLARVSHKPSEVSGGVLRLSISPQLYQPWWGVYPAW